MPKLCPLLLVCFAAGCAGPRFVGVEASSSLSVSGLQTEAATRELAAAAVRELDLEVLLALAAVDTDCELVGVELVRGPALPPASYPGYALLATSPGLSELEEGELGDRRALLVLQAGLFASGQRPEAQGEQPGLLIAVVRVPAFHTRAEHSRLVEAVAQRALGQLEARVAELASERGASLEFLTPGRGADPR